MRPKDYIDAKNINDPDIDNMYLFTIRDFYRSHPACDNLQMKVTDILAVENDPKSSSFIEITYRRNGKTYVMSRIAKDSVCNTRMSKKCALQIIVTLLYDQELAKGYTPGKPAIDYRPIIKPLKEADELFMEITFYSCFTFEQRLLNNLSGSLKKKKHKMFEKDPSGKSWDAYVQSYRKSYEKNHVRVLKSELESKENEKRKAEEKERKRQHEEATKRTMYPQGF